jgi:putative DNA primase/helicase
MNVIDEAQGKWVGLMQHFGLNLKYRKHQPCPMCGGKDRFIFDDKENRGTFHCNNCGAGTGFTLLTKVKGWEMRQAMAEVEKVVGGYVKTMNDVTIDDAKRRKALNEVWSGAREVVEGDPVHKYLSQRTGLLEVPRSIRFHPALWHSDEKAEFPAMVAKITGPDNKPVSIHRTYLTDNGEKAPIEKSRMLMAGSLPEGSAIRLFPYSEVLGVAEGIETAISAWSISGIPTWSVVSASILLKWTPPPLVKRLVIFGDNDKLYAGQMAAYHLAWRMASKFLDVSVVIPQTTGADWNDVLVICGTEDAKAQYQGLL